MFNRNGNNGAHDGAAVASRNGNGHKPDAAIPAEHDLALGRALARRHPGARSSPSTPSLVSQRKGRGGRTFDYIEGHAVIDQANRIFGYGGWGYELVGDVTLRQVETVDLADGRGEGLARLQRTRSGSPLPATPAPHRPRRPPGHRGQLSTGTTPR